MKTEAQDRVLHNRCMVCEHEGVQWPACEEGDHCPFAFLAEPEIRMPAPSTTVFASVLRMFISAIIGSLTIVALILAMSRFFGLTQ